MSKVLIIEDERLDFNTFSNSYKEFNYKCIPHDYEELIDNSDTEDKLYNFIKRKIIYEDISFISLDLNLRNFGFDDETNPSNEQTGINILKRITNSSIYCVRTIPILIVSKFLPSEIETHHTLSKFIISHVHKDNIGARSVDRLLPLAEYIKEINLDLNIKRDIEKQKAFILPEFNHLFNDIKTFNEIITLKKELITALTNDCIIPSYQGIVRENRQIDKYEVLARVNDLKNSFFKYINVAKFYGLLSDVTKEVIQKSFSYIKSDKSLSLSINIDYEDLDDSKIDDFIIFIKDEINLNNLNFDQITLEILEGVRHNKAILNNIKKLKDCGFKIAIDDFGIENSNFLRLKHLIEQKCIHYLKIDRKFIEDIAVSSLSKNIVSSLVKLANEEKIEVVLEFIADEEIFNMCKTIDPNLLYQGFYFSEPSLSIESKI